MNRRYVPSSISTELGNRQSVNGGDVRHIVGYGGYVLVGQWLKKLLLWDRSSLNRAKLEVGIPTYDLSGLSRTLPDEAHPSHSDRTYVHLVVPNCQPAAHCRYLHRVPQWTATLALLSHLEASGSQIPTTPLQHRPKMAFQEAFPHSRRSLLRKILLRDLERSRISNKHPRYQPMASCGQLHH